MKERLKVLWCELTHAGGHIKRDPEGRINWQCSECGRWSTPVSEEDERRVVDRELEAHRRRKGLTDVAHEIRADLCALINKETTK